MKRVLAIHDISSIGRTSLTMCIPVISSFNMQVCPFVTAVLSASTAYKDFEIVDLTKNLEGFTRSWERLNENFDIFYSGFLGSSEQQRIIEKMFTTLKFQKVVIDPVFADNEKLYCIFDETIVEGFRKLIKYADIITPNITEFRMLSKTNDLNSKEEILKAAEKLDFNGTLIITSVSKENLLGTVCYNTKTKEYSEFFLERLEKEFSGTGDLFTSLLIGYAEKFEIKKAAEKATNAIHKIIKNSIEARNDNKEGVLIENFLMNKFDS